MVEQVLRIFESEVRTSKMQTFLTLAPSYHNHGITTLVVDPNRVMQILINFVANAIKFTKNQDTRVLDITLSASLTRPEDGVKYVPSGRCRKDPTQLPAWGDGEAVFLQISVRDTGPGLTEEDMNILFAKFRQPTPKTHVQYGGSGLGLFISRELAELHGGEVGIASQLGEGSNFAFYVKSRRPTRKTPAEADHDTKEDSLRKESLPLPKIQRPGMSRRNSPMERIVGMAAAELPEEHTLSKSSILLVEDNFVNQKVLSKQLRKLGYVVRTANHGLEALAMIRSSNWWQGGENGSIPVVTTEAEHADFDLNVVLMDIEMPVMDGKACVMKIREMQQEGLLHEYIPVIAVTGNARSQQIVVAKECGFDDVVSKPYRIADLVPRIEKFAEGDSC